MLKRLVNFVILIFPHVIHYLPKLIGIMANSKE